MQSSHNAKYKTSGSCPLGPKCHFAHGEHELRKMSDPLPQGSRHQGSGEHKAYQSFGQNPVPSSVSNYKTVKCKFFEKGFCKYGEGCSFAHGETDVRSQSSPVPQEALNKHQMNNMNYSFYQQSLQNQIVHQQVESLIKQIEGYHKEDEEIQSTLNKAKQLLQSGNSQAAASVVNEIINGQAKSKQDSDAYLGFVNNTQTLGAYIFQQSQYMQNPNQMMYGFNPAGMSPMGMAPSMGASYNGGVDMSQYGQHQYNNPKQGYSKNYQHRGGYRGNRDQSGVNKIEENNNEYKQEQRYHHQKEEIQDLSNDLENVQISNNQQHYQPHKNV